jgi:hypothetical protein
MLKQQPLNNCTLIFSGLLQFTHRQENGDTTTTHHDDTPPRHTHTVANRDIGRRLGFSTSRIISNLSPQSVLFDVIDCRKQK